MNSVLQATWVLVVPGFVIVITPAQVHMHLQVTFSAGMPRNITVGDPGTQGAGVTGTQGIGVNTPSAAAVAAATVGLARELHMPKGGMLTIGLESPIFAAGGPSAMTGGATTINVDGAAPKLHCNMAPILTSGGMNHSPFRQVRDQPYVFYEPEA
jgi:hypothetical protein